MTLFILYLFIGALAGTLSGLFGIGGGIVVVPFLATIYDKIGFPHDMIMHFAAGTSLAVMIITTSASLRAHVKVGNQVWPIFKLLLPGLALGVVVGAIVADVLHSHVLRLMFGALLLVVSMRAFFIHKVEASENLPSRWVMTLSSIAMGTISGMLGVGGGALLVPFLLHYNVSIRVAVAISTAAGVLIALVGSTAYMITGANEIHLIHWTTGFIYWPAFFGIAMASPIFATIGANWSNRLPVEMLRKLFSFLILLAAIKLIVY